ncbi:hypothetical protein [Streptomyces lydicus]|uniref:hypothetical protein n=1 Tax=Streptomyces lydicus TaxID=47763 RepID=UPI0037A300B3
MHILYTLQRIARAGRLIDGALIEQPAQQSGMDHTTVRSSTGLIPRSDGSSLGMVFVVPQRDAFVSASDQPDLEP